MKLIKVQMHQEKVLNNYNNSKNPLKKIISNKMLNHHNNSKNNNNKF